MFTKASFTAALFATAALAQNVLRTEDVLSTPYASLLGFSDDTMEVARGLSSKATTTTNSSIPSDVHLLPDGSLDFTAWNNITSAACQARLSQIVHTSNPSGDCICYNLPMLNVNTGMFEADLRLYRVSDPRDAFVGVPPSGIQVGVSYKGASVSPMKPVTSGSSSPAVNITKRSDGSSTPTLLQSYMLVGQIDKDQMQNNLSIAALQALVMPTLTLSAVTSSGSQISSNVSLNEASFLVGVFSNDVILSDFAAAQKAVAVQQAALKNGTVAFVLPGVNILIFPVGLIITSIWLVIGLAAYGFGTYQRIQYATQYRRRAVHASKGDSAYCTF